MVCEKSESLEEGLFDQDGYQEQDSKPLPEVWGQEEIGEPRQDVSRPDLSSLIVPKSKVVVASVVAKREPIANGKVLASLLPGGLIPSWCKLIQ